MGNRATHGMWATECVRIPEQCLRNRTLGRLVSTDSAINPNIRKGIFIRCKGIVVVHAIPDPVAASSRPRAPFRLLQGGRGCSEASAGRPGATMRPSSGVGGCCLPLLGGSAHHPPDRPPASPRGRPAADDQLGLGQVQGPPRCVPDLGHGAARGAIWPLAAVCGGGLGRRRPARVTPGSSPQWVGGGRVVGR